MRHVVTVSLPEKMASELDSIAKETGRNKSDILKESLGEYIWEQKFGRMKKRLSSKAKAPGFFTDEDVFKAIS